MKNLIIVVEAILYLTGASSLEELDEETLCRFERLESLPVLINYCSRNSLKESGLVSAYQAASLIEYRERTGAILSETELGLIDGFTPETARALMPFISLESESTPGLNTKKHSRSELTMNGGFRKSDGTGESASARYSYDNRTCSVNAGFKYNGKADGSVCATFSGRKAIRLVVLGDYNLSYGQGACLWSGFTLNGVPTVDAIYRKPSGISRSVSSSRGNKYRGLAASFATGRFTEDIFYSYMELAGGNIGFSGKSFNMDLTAYKGSKGWGLGLSGRGTLHKTDIFGEAAYTADGLNIIAGTVWNIAYKVKCAGRVSKGKDGYSLAAGAQYKYYSLTAEYRNEFLKIILSGRQPLTSEKAAVQSVLELKASTRKQEAWKTEIRIDSRNTWNGLELNARADMLWNKSVASLVYIEAGYRRDRLYAYLRGTLFLIDSWDDRIYVYERDVPSSFNVPAYHGRGWNASIVLRWKNLYLRAATTQYPSGSKRPKAELKMQYKLVW